MSAKKPPQTSRQNSPRDGTQTAVVTEYRVSFDEAADADLAAISDQATVEVLVRRALELKTDPMLQGKALTDNLKGYRSVRAAGQRYRLVYRVFEQAGDVVIVVVGIRKAGNKRDVYRVASKRLS